MRIKSARKRRISSRAKKLLKIFFPYPGVPGRLTIKVPPIIAITMSTLKRISIPSAVKCIYSFRYGGSRELGLRRRRHAAPTWLLRLLNR